MSSSIRFKFLLATTAVIGLLLGNTLFSKTPPPKSLERPNFLLVITDDQSWKHTSFAGYPAVSTPNFDRLASEGVYFRNAYASAPTCTASRSAILTGQHFWRLGSAGQLWGEFPSSLTTYQQILEKNGYKIGYTGKGWGPGKALLGNPAGPAYNQIRSNARPEYTQFDMLNNFKQFLDEKKPDQPFSFWISPTEPHREFQTGIGAKSGEIKLDKIIVPPFLPDVPTVRNDIADYLYEIQYFDKQLGDILQLLESRGELDNTVIVYTSDNGMPFPRSKSTNYEYGTHEPFAVRWGDAVTEHRDITDFISLTDIAPTFLDLAGITPPAAMTGRSFRKQLFAEKSGRIDKNRDSAFSGFERHIGGARLERRGYPSRAIHADKFLYIANLAPDRWPAGRPPNLADIDDGSPSKVTIADRAQYEKFWRLAADKRPAEELYAIDRDPYQLNNLANNPEFKAIKESLKQRLQQEMQQTGDPWAAGKGADFDDYTYYGKESE
ncbi:MAG TPA: sulfatase [Pseudomonadales bacterium]|nr:sulfatase [Pseudomonadales bacterium]HRG49934.1 sulfatase [Pseudomonadales bacterium]